MRALSKIMPKITQKVVGKIGVEFGNLILSWPQVVGVDIAQKCRIQKFLFPKGEKGNATVTLDVQSYFATDCQYMLPQLIEKINRFMGFRAVAGMKLKQVMTPFQDHHLPQLKTVSKKLTAQEKAEIEKIIEDSDDERIQDLLRQLGEGVYAKSHK